MLVNVAFRGRNTLKKGCKLEKRIWILYGFCNLFEREGPEKDQIKHFLNESPPKRRVIQEGPTLKRLLIIN